MKAMSKRHYVISLFEIDFWLQTEAVMLEALLCHPKDIDIAIRVN